MELGAFSMSLAVKDITASKQFYAKLGFDVFGGNESENWLIMRNGEHMIGLFQGMFEDNILTFNPGWNQHGQDTNPFTDIRQWQEHLQSEGIELVESTDPSKSGPAYITLTDPDGNAILIDQHR